MADLSNSLVQQDIIQFKVPKLQSGFRDMLKVVNVPQGVYNIKTPVLSSAPAMGDFVMNGTIPVDATLSISGSSHTPITKASLVEVSEELEQDSAVDFAGYMEGLYTEMSHAMQETEALEAVVASPLSEHVIGAVNLANIQAVRAGVHTAGDRLWVMDTATLATCEGLDIVEYEEERAYMLGARVFLDETMPANVPLVLINPDGVTIEVFSGGGFGRSEHRKMDQGIVSYKFITKFNAVVDMIDHTAYLSLT